MARAPARRSREGFWETRAEKTDKNRQMFYLGRNWLSPNEPTAVPSLHGGDSTDNMTHEQEVSMSCEWIFSLSSCTSAHRSPMVCSRRGSTSNTAGNWLIHCLAPKHNTKHVYYSDTRPVALRPSAQHLLTLLTWQGGRSEPAWVPVCRKDNPCKWGKESRMETRCWCGPTCWLWAGVQTTNLLCRRPKQSPACFLIWLTNGNMWLEQLPSGAGVPRWAAGKDIGQEVSGQTSETAPPNCASLGSCGPTGSLLGWKSFPPNLQSRHSKHLFSRFKSFQTDYGSLGSVVPESMRQTGSRVWDKRRKPSWTGCGLSNKASKFRGWLH